MQKIKMTKSSNLQYFSPTLYYFRLPSANLTLLRVFQHLYKWSREKQNHARNVCRAPNLSQLVGHNFAHPCLSKLRTDVANFP